MASDVGYAIIVSQNDVISWIPLLRCHFCAAKETRESATKASLFEHCQGLDDELCKIYMGVSVLAMIYGVPSELKSAYSSEGACPCS